MSPPVADMTPKTRTISARAALAGGLAVVGSVVAVELVGALGKAAGATHVKEVSAGAVASLTSGGVLAATVGGGLIGRRRGGKTLLTRLVPIVLVLSFVPDMALGVSGTAWSAVATLLCPHAAVFAVTIPLFAKLLDPTELAPRRAVADDEARRARV